MNESIRIHIQCGGAALRLDSLSSQGIVVGGESSAAPRGLTISLQPADHVTELRLRRVRVIQGWAPGVFRFTAALNNGAIVCRGVDAFSLPFGRHLLRVMISGLRPPRQPINVEVPESGVADVVAGFRADSRRLELVTPVEEFDDRIKAVVLDAGSSLDGETIPRWLDGPARPRRKACLLNILAKARAAGGPAPGSSLIEGIRGVFFADEDRIYAACDASFPSNLRALAADAARPVYYEGAPVAAAHRRLLDAIRSLQEGRESDAAGYRLRSFRLEGAPSLQAVVAIPPGGDPGRPHYAGLDLDLGNPLQDLVGMLVHFGEVLHPGQTDHLKLAGRLARGATRDFHYYRVVESK